jgi:hypothetical protein
MELGVHHSMVFLETPARPLAGGRLLSNKQAGTWNCMGSEETLALLPGADWDPDLCLIRK